MSQIYNKLVRDKIPDIIKTNGEEPVVRVLNDDEYKMLLDKKLLEEVNEYLESSEIEELADILEVIRGICRSKNVSFEDVLKVMEEKKIKRGGFEDKIFLVEVVKKKSL